MRRFDAADKTEGVFHLATPRRSRDCTAAMHTPFRDGSSRVEDGRSSLGPMASASFPTRSVGWGRGADRASNDADVSSTLPIIPYGGFSPVRLEGWRFDEPEHVTCAIGAFHRGSDPRNRAIRNRA